MAANFNHGWVGSSPISGWPRAIILRLREWHALPDAFLYGFTFVVQFAKARGAFLTVDYGVTGWVSFFPYAFLVKNTLPSLALLLVGVIALLRLAGKNLVARLRPWTPLLALFGVYWATSLTSISTSAIVTSCRRILCCSSRPARSARGSIGGDRSRRCSSARSRWGTSRSRGARAELSRRVQRDRRRHRQRLAPLVDSSLDWGQDLPGLKAWLDAHAHGERASSPTSALASRLRRHPRDDVALACRRRRAPPWTGACSGLYAISATMLRNLQPRAPATGRWRSKMNFNNCAPSSRSSSPTKTIPARRAHAARCGPRRNGTPCGCATTGCGSRASTTTARAPPEASIALDPRLPSRCGGGNGRDRGSLARLESADRARGGALIEDPQRRESQRRRRAARDREDEFARSPAGATAPPRPARQRSARPEAASKRTIAMRTPSSRNSSRTAPRMD